MAFVKFYSSVAGRLVHRLGYKGIPLGATVTSEGIEWNTSEVVAITDREWQTTGRAYEKLVKAGCLVERTAEEYQAQMAQNEES